MASARGIGVLLDVGFTAPAWATADPPGADRPRTRVDPAAFARFAQRIARRYDGAHPGLPRVAAFSLWNEPNHNAFLLPQWKRQGGRFVPASPARYRRMVRAAYPAIKAVQPSAKVLIGGTSSEGSYTGRGVGPVPPMRFLRDLACVDRKLRPLRNAACRKFAPLPGDGWTHHPYSLRAEPGAVATAKRPDDIPLGSLNRLTSTLGRLVAMGRLAPGLADVYITEYGYESNPPSTLQRWSMGDQARFLAWSEYLAWRNPRVKSFAQFLLRDTPPAPVRVSPSLRRPYGEWGSGLFFADGTPKLASLAFEAGLYVRRASRGRILVWGHLRVGAGARPVRLEVRSRRGASWRGLPSRPVDAQKRSATFDTQIDGVFQRVATAPSGARLRLRYGAGLATTSLSARAANPVAHVKR